LITQVLRGIVARYRKTAIAALAASALLLAPTAAYADHNHRGVSASSEDSGMSWGYYSGKLTDYTTTEPDVFKDARASAVMIGLDGRSFFRLRVSGINAKKGVYGVHLHQGTCDAKDWDAAKGHYNVTWDPIELAIMGEVSKKTEVWLDLKVDSDGDARSTATVDFIPEGERSIVLHAAPTVAQAKPGGPAVGSAGARLACLPFNIKVYGD
jgi:Cu/Zn superoxide dismutase